MPSKFEFTGGKSSQSLGAIPLQSKSELKTGTAERQEESVVVVIPFYNGSNFIERSVQSVLDQTVPPKEFVVVDDGSSAKEAAKLDEIAKRMGFRVLRKKNGGQGSARNAGVAATNAEFICFLDQDDFYLRNHIETLLDAKPNNDPHFGWVYGELFEAEGNGDIIRTSIVSHHARHPKTHINDLLASDMFVLPSSSLISRKAYVAVGGFDEQFMGYEDDDLFLRLFRAGFTNYFTEKPVTVWCIHTESTSYGIRMSRSRLAYFKKLVKNFPDDKAKQRFYIRDLIIPRFHNTIMGEAAASVSDEANKFSENSKEYLAIAQSYVDTVLTIPSLSPEFCKALKDQMDGFLGKPLLGPEQAHSLATNQSNMSTHKIMRFLDKILPKSYVQKKNLRNLQKQIDFEPAWYLQRYPDVAAAGMDPFSHFIMHGRKEGRAPNRTRHL